VKISSPTPVLKNPIPYFALIQTTLGHRALIGIASLVFATASSKIAPFIPTSGGAAP
jgi:hypothetical protein